MIRKAIAFTTGDGRSVVEEHHFNLSKAELVSMNLGYPNGASDYIKRIVADRDVDRIKAMVQDIVKRAYGQKVGDEFVKSEDALIKFVASRAYLALLDELYSERYKAVEFVNGIVPQDLRN